MGSQRQCLPQRRSSVSILVPQIGNQAALTYAALLTPSLLPTTGLVFRGMDGVATAVPPAAQIVRFNFGASITGCIGYLSWHGINFPPGMMDIRNAVSMDLVLAGSLADSAGYSPTASVGYSASGLPATLATFTNVISSSTAGP